jgi:hypothetical protein
MSNMSSCRFRNTKSDLEDCKNALEDLAGGEERLDKEELEAAVVLINTCAEILQLVQDGSGINILDEVPDDAEIRKFLLSV